MMPGLGPRGSNSSLEASASAVQAEEEHVRQPAQRSAHDAHQEEAPNRKA